MSDEGYVIVRQQAGTFTRAYSTDRACFVRRSKQWLRKELGRAMQRTPVDALEFQLALFRYDGVFYTLTFSPEKTPKNWKQARDRWEYFLRKKIIPWRKAQDIYEKRDAPAEIDYVYRIEHLHTKGGEGWHIHCFLRDRDFPPVAVRLLWPYGTVDDEPWTYQKVHAAEGYRVLAKYFTKERPEVGRHAYGASKDLKRKMPKAQVSYNQTGAIGLPLGAVRLPASDPVVSEWGVFNYARYLSS